MAFSIGGMIAVVWNVFGTLILIALAVVAVDAVLLWIGTRRPAAPAAGRRAARASALLGVAAAVAVFLLLPWWTQSSLRWLNGFVDFAALTAAALAAGFAVAVLAFPAVRLLTGAVATPGSEEGSAPAAGSSTLGRLRPEPGHDPTAGSDTRTVAPRGMDRASAGRR